MDQWTEARVQAALDQMTQTDPSEVALTIGDFKQLHRCWALSRYGRFIKYFEDGFEVLNNIIFNTNYLDKSGWPSHRSVQYFFAADALKPLFRAMEDAVDGFCDETLILTRSVYETFLRIVFISCYPTEWEATLLKRRREQIEFNVTNFPKEHLRVEWDFIYQTHSLMSHSKKYYVLRRLGVAQSFVGLDLHVDEAAMSRATNSLTFTLWALLHVSHVLFFELAPDAKLMPEAKARVEATDEAFEGLVAQMPNSFARTAGDVLKIGRIVLAAEQGDDWRQLA